MTLTLLQSDNQKVIDFSQSCKPRCAWNDRSGPKIHQNFTQFHEITNNFHVSNFGQRLGRWEKFAYMCTYGHTTKTWNLHFVTDKSCKMTPQSFFHAQNEKHKFQHLCTKKHKNAQTRFVPKSGTSTIIIYKSEKIMIFSLISQEIYPPKITKALVTHTFRNYYQKMMEFSSQNV